MRKYLFTLVAMFFMALVSISQRNCASDAVFQRQNADPSTKKMRSSIERHTQRFIKSGGHSNYRQGVLTIPVIVHVIYNTNQQNISDAQIQSQIDVLTDDFRKLNTDVGLVPSEFTAVDSEIEFDLVEITRKQTTRSSWGANDAMKNASLGGVAVVDPDHFLNIWVCNIGGGILGYAQFPGGSSATDGVVVSPQYFGTIDAEPAGEIFFLSAPFDKGRTATHEVGHYLNLRHIWGDGGCSVDDFVSDTPIAGGPNYSCPSYPSKSCNNNGGFTSDMFMNYMDYVNDDCMYMFSVGQKTRMDALFEEGGFREDLGTLENCELSAPGGLTASSIGVNGFALTWNVVSGADSYDVSVSGSVTNVSGNTIVLSGLSSGTSYDVKVRAVCTTGGGGLYSPVLTITTTGSNCKVGAVTLSLSLDRYPRETSWSLLKDGSEVASGGDYTTRFQQISEVFSFGDGNYSFTIEDSYGDGICCSYGQGSYSLTDGNGGVIVSGGSFNFSESTDYCISGTSSSAVESSFVDVTRSIEHADFIEFYPNPIRNEVFVTLDVKNHAEINAMVMDIQGRTMLNQSWKNQEGHVTLRLDFSTLESGLYFIRMMDNNGLDELRKVFKE